MARDPIPTWFFVLVVVRRDDRFLLVHEKRHGQTWYLPAGRVEPGEKLEAAALRETLEESGIPIRLEGVLRIEHTPMQDFARVRVVFMAHPADETPPVSEPNEDVLEARWVTIEEAAQLPLRGLDVLEVFHYVNKGATVYPMSVITREGDPYT